MNAKGTINLAEVNTILRRVQILGRNETHGEGESNAVGIYEDKDNLVWNLRNIFSKINLLMQLAKL